MTAPPTGKRLHTREDSGIRLDRHGTWWHDDERVEHPKIIEAFNRGLEPTDDGRFKLTFGWDWCFVQVEGAAYRVLAIHGSHGEDDVLLTLSDRTQTPLDPATLHTDEEGVLQCRVKEGRALARFTRDAQFELGSRLEAEGEGWVLRVRGRAWPL